MSPYRNTETICEICGKTTAPADIRDVFGIRMCSTCRAGEIDEALERRGMKRSSRRFSADTDSYFSVMIERKAALEVILRFTREGLAGRLMDLVGKGDLKVGDREFDRLVHIEVDETSGAGVEPLLDHGGIREGILALLGSGRESTVEITHGLVSAVVRWGAVDAEADTEQFALAALALAWNVMKVEEQMKRGVVTSR